MERITEADILWILSQNGFPRGLIDGRTEDTLKTRDRFEALDDALTGFPGYIHRPEIWPILRLVYTYVDKIFEPACPRKGAFIGWKRCQIRLRNGEERHVIVELLIPAGAKRSSAFGRKCRCSKAKVLDIRSLDGRTLYQEAESFYEDGFKYRVGKWIRVHGFDRNRFKECARGIHFFMTRKEAETYWSQMAAV